MRGICHCTFSVDMVRVKEGVVEEGRAVEVLEGRKVK